MRIAFLIGRIIFGLVHVVFGLNHFLKFNMMVQYAGSKGVPLPNLAIIFTGLLLVVGGVLILLGYYPKIGVLLLVIFYIPVTFMMHNFWAVAEPMRKLAETTNFMKNMAILGSTLMFLMIPEPWEYSIGKK